MIEFAADSLFRPLVDALPDGVVIVDNLRVVFANPAAVELTGATSAAQLIGQPIERFVHASSRADVKAMTTNFMAGRSRSGVTTIDFHRLDGTTLIAELSASRVAELPATAAMVVIKDVTARIRLGRELEQAEARSRFLAENSADVLIRVQSQVGISYASPSSSEVLGIESHDMVGRQLLELFAPQDRSAVTAALTSAEIDQPRTIEVRSAAQTGRPSRWVEVAIRPVGTGDLPADTEFHVTISDITQRRAVAAELSVSEARQRMILDGLQEGVILHTLGTDNFLANPVAKEVLGIDTDQDSPYGTNSLVGLFFEPDGSPMDPRDSPLSRAHRTRRPHLRRPLQFVRPGQERRWMEWDAIPMHDLDSRPAVLVTFRDVTVERSALERLAESAQLLASVMSAATHEAIIVTDNNATIVAFSRGAEDRFGYSAADVVGTMSVAELHDADDLAEYAATQGVSVAELIRRPPPYDGVSNIESIMRRADGSTFVGSMNVSSRLDEGGVPVGFLYVLNDVTERRQIEADLLDRVARDHLTGLFNRRVLETRLAAMAIEEWWSEPGRILMFIDLDHFKEVNDAAGHQVGDIVLVQAATRIVGCVRTTDSVFRYGGDEFVVVFDASVSMPVASEVAQRIVAELAEPFMFAGGVSTIGASVGLARSTATVTPEQLVHAADSAVYLAKRSGRGKVVCLD